MRQKISIPLILSLLMRSCTPFRPGGISYSKNTHMCHPYNITQKPLTAPSILLMRRRMRCCIVLKMACTLLLPKFLVASPLPVGPPITNTQERDLLCKAEASLKIGIEDLNNKTFQL
jgi:hypothetical protein